MRERPFDPKMSAGGIFASPTGPENCLIQGGCYYTYDHQWIGVANEELYQKWLESVTPKEAPPETPPAREIPPMPDSVRRELEAGNSASQRQTAYWEIRKRYIKKFGEKAWKILPPPKTDNASRALGEG